MQRVIAQAHRRPYFGDPSGRRDIDAVEELRGDGHRLALVLPQMRDQRAQLVEQRDHRRDREGHQQRLPAEGEHAGNQRPAPDHAAHFLPEHPRTQIAFGRAAAEFGIDRERAQPLPRQPPDRRDDRAQRDQHGKAQQQSCGCQQRDQHEHRQAPGLHQRQREIFGILDRAILRALVVQRVDAFIHEGRGQHGNADQHVPRGAEAGQRTVPQMRNFVDEQQRAIQREYRDARQQDRQRQAAGQDRASQRAIADQRRTDHVGPVDVGTVRGDVLGQVARGAQHRLVVGNLGMPARSRVAARKQVGTRNAGLLHGHNRISWEAPSRKHARDTARAVDHSDRCLGFLDKEQLAHTGLIQAERECA